jgi:hypothetical protein
MGSAVQSAQTPILQQLLPFPRMKGSRDIVDMTTLPLTRMIAVLPNDNPTT